MIIRIYSRHKPVTSEIKNKTSHSEILPISITGIEELRSCLTTQYAIELYFREVTCKANKKMIVCLYVKNIIPFYITNSR